MKIKLIVGLGNPGVCYNNTRHNTGFRFIDFYAKLNCVEINKEKFNGKYVEFLKNDVKIVLLKPQSFINLSGEVIKKYIDYYKISIDDLLVVHDDLDLSCGKIKLRPRGSSAGHNGLKNIENNLQSDEYKRLKIGISNNKDIDTKDYVLGCFTNEEEKLLLNLQETIANIIDDFLVSDFDIMMAKYNRK